jgi:hypothetical protein
MCIKGESQQRVAAIIAIVTGSLREAMTNTPRQLFVRIDI